jgi:enolase
MVMPVGAPASRGRALGAEIFHSLKKVLKAQGLQHLRRRRGRLCPELGSNERPSRSSWRPSRRPATKPGEEVFIALDPAASEIYERGQGQVQPGFKSGRKKPFGEDDGRLLGQDWIDKYPIISHRRRPGRGRLGLGWQAAEERSRRSKVQLVGDDLFVTNVERVQRAIEKGVPATRCCARSTRSAR